jgi:RNA polymerase sigma-70 factor, ECF subfamily
MAQNRDLFWQLVEPEDRRARAYCRKLMANREDGDDLYHDALVRALTRFDGLRDIGSFRNWLYKIIISTFRNRIRRPFWRRSVSINTESSDKSGGEDMGAIQAARRRLEVAFQALSPDERALVTLRELHGWPIEELAQLRGKSPENLRVMLFRARRKMRKALLRNLRKRGAEVVSARGKSEDLLCVAQKYGRD